VAEDSNKPTANKPGRPRLSESGPTRSLTIRLTPEDFARLRELCRRNGGASAGAVIRQLLRADPSPATSGGVDDCKS